MTGGKYQVRMSISDKQQREDLLAGLSSAGTRQMPSISRTEKCISETNI